jgi:hypothetical protein
MRPARTSSNTFGSGSCGRQLGPAFVMLSLTDSIRLNRDNIAESLGFLGRVVHGKNKAEWLKELRTRIGESPHYAQTQ